MKLINLSKKCSAKTLLKALKKRNTEDNNPQENYIYISQRIDQKFYLLETLEERGEETARIFKITKKNFTRLKKNYGLKTTDINPKAEKDLSDNEETSSYEQMEKGGRSYKDINDRSRLLGHGAHSHAFIIKFQQCALGIAEAIKNNDMLTIQIIINIFRDFAWTWFSYDNYNYRFTTTADTNYDYKGQWGGQQVAGTAAMLLAGGLLIAGISCYKKGAKEVPWLAIAKYIVAAGAAIYTWDRAQQLGIYIFQNLCGFPPLTAALLAGFFTGAAEGPTQFVFIKLGDLAAFLKDPDSRKEFIKNPKATLAKLGIDAALSGFVPGAPGQWPGDVWQFVYAACVAAKLGATITSTLVSTAVAKFNGVTSKANDAISAKLVAKVAKGPLHSNTNLIIYDDEQVDYDNSRCCSC